MPGTVSRLAGLTCVVSVRSRTPRPGRIIQLGEERGRSVTVSPSVTDHPSDQRRSPLAAAFPPIIQWWFPEGETHGTAGLPVVRQGADMR